MLATAGLCGPPSSYPLGQRTANPDKQGAATAASLPACLLQTALKFEHNTSKGCTPNGPPYEWTVYK